MGLDTVPPTRSWWNIILPWHNSSFCETVMSLQGFSSAFSPFSFDITTTLVKKPYQVIMYALTFLPFQNHWKFLSHAHYYSSLYTFCCGVYCMIWFYVGGFQNLKTSIFQLSITIRLFMRGFTVHYTLLSVTFLNSHFLAKIQNLCLPTKTCTIKIATEMCPPLSKGANSTHTHSHIFLKTFN